MRNPNRLLLLFMTAILYSTTIYSQIQEPLKVAKESEVDITKYTGIISEQYANGSPSVWKNVVNGLSEGLWLEWYPNGTLRYRAFWKNGLGNGRWEYFYPNGNLRSVSFYINDIAQGILKSYHENGQLKYDASYMDGKKDGLEFTYDASGFLLSRRRYENGILCLDQPVIFEEGKISGLHSHEWFINFMPDGKTAYFTRRSTSGEKRIYMVVKTESGWSEPSIAPFSTHEDEAAFINRDASKLYFASFRPLPGNTSSHKVDMNIWYVDRINGQWSAPKPLSSVINQSMKKDNVWPANYEAGPMTDENGNLYYWTKGASSTTTNLYYSEKREDGSFGEAQELIPPSSNEFFDTSPQLSPDGKILFFSSDNRNDGYGGSDIYYSVRKDGTWSAPENLGPIVNSSQSDAAPSFSADGKYFYFSSDRGDLKDINGDRISNLYYMETKYLMIKK